MRAPAAAALCSRATSRRRPRPAPRTVGATQSRLISLQCGAPRRTSWWRSAPQPTGSPFRVATRRSPAGGTRSDGSSGLARSMSKPPSKRAASSAKYEPRLERACGWRGSHGCETDHRRGQEALHHRHGLDQTCSLRFSQRLQDRGRDRVVAPVELGALGKPGSRQPRRSHAAVRLARPDDDEPVGGERREHAAQVAGVEPEPVPQRADVGALGADLPEHPRLAERPASGQERLVERAGALGDDAVEPPHLGYPLFHNSLTIVREYGCSQVASWAPRRGWAVPRLREWRRSHARTGCSSAMPGSRSPSSRTTPGSSTRTPTSGTTSTGWSVTATSSSRSSARTGSTGRSSSASTSPIAARRSPRRTTERSPTPPPRRAS